MIIIGVGGRENLITRAGAARSVPLTQSMNKEKLAKIIENRFIESLFREEPFEIEYLEIEGEQIRAGLTAQTKEACLELINHPQFEYSCLTYNDGSWLDTIYISDKFDSIPENATILDVTGEIPAEIELREAEKFGYDADSETEHGD